MGSLTPDTFMQLLAESLAPDLPVTLLRQDKGLLLYVGVWSTWWPGRGPHGDPA